MTIDSQTRNAAADLCQMAASTMDVGRVAWLDSANTIATSADAIHLAVEAALYVIERSHVGEIREYYAEAEAMLRTGWSP